MTTRTKRFCNIILVFSLIFTMLTQNAIITSAATNTMVYEYTTMFEDNGYIYYIQTVEGDKKLYNIYRLDTTTGNKTKLVSSKKYILNMMVHNGTLYYTSSETVKDTYFIYALSIDTNVKKTFCTGCIVALDDSSVYYTIGKGVNTKLYKKDCNSKKSTLIHKGNMNFGFIKKIDDTLYFSEYKDVTSKIYLYMLKPGETKLTVLTTEKITANESEWITTEVSDIVKVNGDIYYQYGTHEGSGSFWYGTLKKLDTATKKKSVIVEDLYEEQIYHNDSCIFYSGTESSQKNYQYNTKTNKTTAYKCGNTNAEAINILGDNTYCAKMDGKASIAVSRFTTGTNKENLVNPFITFSYKQKKDFNYSIRITKVGDYLLMPVTCMDYNDGSYGWRGRCVNITWFVVNSEGKLIAKLQ